jgi:hypothetical protein
MMSPFPAEYGTGAAASSVKSAILAANATGVVVRPEVSYLRVVGSFPTQWTGSVPSQCV